MSATDSCRLAVLLTLPMLPGRMSDAVDSAAVMLYAVSAKYKESGNCRLEANYAHQQEVDMIPLMVQEDYKAKGWLGLVSKQKHPLRKMTS